MKTKTSSKKYNKKIKEYNEWLKVNRTMPVKEIINKTNEKLKGHFQYFGVTYNSRMINKFRYRIIMILFKWLNRRSQKKSYTWEEFNALLKYNPIAKARVTINIYDI